ncbi:MAG: arsenate reductase ArsC [Pirellulales bacterium]
MTTPPKLRILFLCTGNSCRSQMAEGWARRLRGDVVEPYSAGIVAHGLNERAVRVMAEAGVDISTQSSQTLADHTGVVLDYIVTVCDHAASSCPAPPPGVTVVHAGFDDPPTLTADFSDEEAKLAVYRRVRDEIRGFVETLPAALRAVTDPPQTRIV